VNLSEDMQWEANWADSAPGEREGQGEEKRTVRDRLLATSQYWASVWRIRRAPLGVARHQPLFDDTKLEGVRLKIIGTTITA
jgi:hypothetical protein